MTEVQILNERQIRQKVRRLAIEIYERNLDESMIILAGINHNGIQFAHMLLEQLLKITDIPITVTRIRLNPAHPLEDEAQVEMPLSEIEGKCIIVVDDVANSGRTICYALKPLLRVLPKKIEVAVLVDRKHKSFPIRADYVGLSLATTLQENIDVRIREVEQVSVYLN